MNEKRSPVLFGEKAAAENSLENPSLIERGEKIFFLIANVEILPFSCTI